MKKIVVSIWSLSLIAQLFLATPLKAAPKDAKSPFKIKVTTDKPEALYKVGEKIIFNVSFLENDKPLAGENLYYRINKDGSKPKSGTIVSGEQPIKIESELNRPGFVLCYVSSKDKDKKNIRGYGGAGVEPLKIKASRPSPEDFDKFWAEKKAELAKIPMKPELTPEPLTENLKKKVECFDIKINCPGGMPMSGYFAKPLNAKPKSLPIFIGYHGAGVRSSYKRIGQALQGMLCLDINAHGIVNGKPKEFYQELRAGKYKGYPYWGADSKENIYFLGMFFRLMRSMQFMMAQPEWDGKTLIVSGSSQGGAQALVAAGLEPKVTFCVARVPALCDHTGILEKQSSGWPRFIRFGKDGKPVNPKIVETVPYFDAANFAERIKADTIVTTGFIDTTCAPTSVYAAYNNIKSKKEIINNVLSGHKNPKETSSIISKKLHEYIKSQKEEK